MTLASQAAATELETLLTQVNEEDAACCDRGRALLTACLLEIRKLRELLALEERHHGEHIEAESGGQEARS